ncbi:hypothetical protein [Devosia sp. CAU 1758]
MLMLERQSWQFEYAVFAALLALAGLGTVLLDDATLVLVAAVSLCLTIVALRPSPTDPSASLVMVLLLLASAYPLLISHVSDASLVALGSSLRIGFHQPEWIAKALAIVLFQCAALVVATARSDRRQGGLVSLLRVQERSPWPGTLALAVCMVVTTVLANRTSTILSGNYGEVEPASTGWFSGWPVLYCAASAWYMVRTRMSRWYDYVFWYAVIAYWLFHGNRSEILIQSMLPILVFAAHGPRVWSVLGGVINWRRVPAALVMAVSVLLMFESVGLLRSHAVFAPPTRVSQPTSSLTPQVAPLPQVEAAAPTLQSAVANARELAIHTGLSRGVALSTIGPSAYTLVAIVGLTETRKLQWQYGKTLQQYVYRIVPSRLNWFPGRAEDMSEVLMREADTLGGSHFAAEAYLNFGIMGAIALAFLVGKYFSLLGRFAASGLIAAWSLASVFYLPRLAWYGYIYMYKLMLLFGFLLACQVAWKLFRTVARRHDLQFGPK